MFKSSGVLTPLVLLVASSVVWSCPQDHGWALSPAGSSYCEEDKSYNYLPDCGHPDLKPGDYCEGDGSCGTDQNLDNCGYGGWDVYYVRQCHSNLVPVLPAQCPADDVHEIAQCFADLLHLDDVCEGEGECGTSNALDNCNGYDVYDICPQLTPVPTCPTGTNEISLDDLLHNMQRCNAANLQPGELCEGDWECNTDGNLNN